jgi:hypothetical protein
MVELNKSIKDLQALSKASHPYIPKEGEKKKKLHPSSRTVVNFSTSKFTLPAKTSEEQP